MFSVSQTAIEQAVRDIRNGVTYPDFWTDREKDNSKQDSAKQDDTKEEKKGEKQAR